MSRGYDEHQTRLAHLNALGKTLARRAHSACELCGASGTPLSTREVAPIPPDPEAGRCIFLCEACRRRLDVPRQADPNHWRCLAASVWSEIPAVQVTAVRILRALAPKHAWAEELLDQLYLEEPQALWADQSPTP